MEIPFLLSYIPFRKVDVAIIVEIDDSLLVLLGLLNTSCGTPLYNRHTLPENHCPLILLPLPHLQLLYSLKMLYI